MKIDGVFNIRENQTSANLKNMFYSLIGKEDFLDDKGNPRIETENSPHTMAKALLNKPSKHINSTASLQYRYYIRTRQNNVIFDPVELLSKVKDKENLSFINNVCKDGIQFTEVTPSIFNQYINYLKTKNSRWLRSAQREIK